MLGRKGTCVFLPHSAQTTSCIVRFSLYPPREPPELFPELRCEDLQPGQRLGSLVNPFSAKKVCSEAVNAKDVPQSRQVRVLSLYMIMYLQFIFPPIGFSFVTVGFRLVSKRWVKPGKITCNELMGDCIIAHSTKQMVHYGLRHQNLICIAQSLSLEPEPFPPWLTFRKQCTVMKSFMNHCNTFSSSICA